jgi:aryl sulfotransferase
MRPAPSHYRSPDEDSGRWLGFRFRPGDIVISTRRKTGTTWMQMICALLIFQAPELPDSLWHLSPWLDNRVVPLEFQYGQLAEQQHRRFIKTHTPLDGIPLYPEVTYIVTARHPLDTFVSLCRHNEIIGHPPEGAGPPPPPKHLAGRPRPPMPGGPPRPDGRHRPPQPPARPMPPLMPTTVPAPPMSPEMLHDAVLGWIADDDDPRRNLDSLPGVLWHLSDAWARRGDPNVLLVHYDDLIADLEGQMRWLAGRLGIAVPENAWPALTQAATLKRMRDSAESIVPRPPGVVEEPSSFFRRGTSGAGREILSDDEMAGYYARAAQLAPPDMLEWLHSPSNLAG